MISIRYIFIFLVVFSFFSCREKKISIPVVDFDQFENYLHRESDSLYIINFWATWCTPCREELPAIEKIGEKYKNEKLKVILVSLDFAYELNKKLIPFVEEHKLKSQVILLSDPRQNMWIDKVDPKWSGALPFTIIYNSKSRESYEHAFVFNELDSIVKLKL